MDFPVDVLEATNHGELERSARSRMNELLYTDPDHAHNFTLPSGKKVQISLSSVGFVPLYGANLQHKVLALFAPQDQLTAVALFLDNQWYSVEDILKTANSRREGLVKVRSVGERIVLYVLNRLVYRTSEMGNGEMPFLCHSENDYAKILWKNGQAVGFYSVKPKGSVCNNFLRQCYSLPVMDTIFVRKAHRGKGYGLQMLEDFVDSFNEDELGLKYPLSPAMANVCRHYLDRYPADIDLFWEVEGVGGPYQRTRVAYKLSCRPLSDTHKDGREEDHGQNGDIVEESEETCLNITEEVIVVNKHRKVPEEIDTPISTRTRSSEHRRKKRVRVDEEAQGMDSQPEKITRMEMAEEEKKELVPADGGVVEPAPEAPTETLVPTVEAHGEQAEDQEEVKEGAGAVDESAILNGTGSEEEEEMEVEEEVEEHAAPAQKTVDTPDEPAAEQREAAPVVEDNQEMEEDTRAHVQQKEDDGPAAEEERVAENGQKEVDTQGAPAAEEKQEVAPAAVEKQEVAPAAEEEQEVASAAVERQEVAPVPKEKQVCPAIEEEEEEAPVSDEDQEGPPAAEEKQDEAAVAEEEQEAAPSVKGELEVAPEIEENETSAAAEEEQEVAPETEDNEVAPKVENQEVDSPAEETSSSLATDAEGDQGQEEAMDVANDIDEVTDTSEQSSKEEEPPGEKDHDTPTVEEEEEEEEAAEKEDEMDEDGEETNVNEASRVLRGARAKAVTPTSKRTSKKPSKMTVEDEEEERGEVKAVGDDKGTSTEEEKVTTEDEAEHSSEEEEQVRDPPAIDKRVLRGKIKVIQTTQRTRSKRRGKM
ncbi:soluble lamin-associated protein of 75 kDa isoform X2 [Ictalurus punctatus]|uniref:Soluble lamin-associated protein of 75 kDa isoform X2 n=1 Tax=Ictalurus punctatus TaxID=7998 RepID=A0A2D0T174_ICTPU|nr:soluble lamin-associated protein of 75 kDa isoform X2 [Ictalurus punctatus]